MIERDIKVIKERQKISRNKTSQELKALAHRQARHEKENIKQFQVITSAISDLPTQDAITKTIQDTIKVVVNGKIDHLTELVNTTTGKVDMVGQHLKDQDAVAEQQGTAIKDLSAKIKPFDGLKNWATETVTGLLYFGGAAAAIWAIIKLFHLKF
jgi:hypothetical protein